MTHLPESFRLPPSYMTALRAMETAEEQTGVRFALVGALARDVQLARAGATPAQRLTEDADVAVAVDNWEQVENLSEALRAEGFERDPRQRQRWHGPERSILDVVPFGGVSEDDVIAWPPDGEVEMSVLGFREAFETADLVRLGDDLEVRVASYPALIALKTISWAEAPYQREKDALDLGVLLQTYHEAVGDRLFDEHDDLLDAEPFDLTKAGARIAGRDIAGSFGSGPATTRLAEILHEQTRDADTSRLVMRMQVYPNDGFALLQNLAQGLAD